MYSIIVYLYTVQVDRRPLRSYEQTEEEEGKTRERAPSREQFILFSLFCLLCGKAIHFVTTIPNYYLSILIVSIVVHSLLTDRAVQNVFIFRRYLFKLMIFLFSFLNGNRICFRAVEKLFWSIRERKRWKKNNQKSKGYDFLESLAQFEYESAGREVFAFIFRFCTCVLHSFRSFWSVTFLQLTDEMNSKNGRHNYFLFFFANNGWKRIRRHSVCCVYVAHSWQSLALKVIYNHFSFCSFQLEQFQQFRE